MQPRVLQRLALTAVLVLGAGVSVVSTAAARPSRPAPDPDPSEHASTCSPGSLPCGSTPTAGLLRHHQLRQPVHRPVGQRHRRGRLLAQRHGRQLRLQRRPADGRHGAVRLPRGAARARGWAIPSASSSWTRGRPRQGDAITNIYSSLNASDIAGWPSAAFVKDPSLYNAALLGRQSISQQDTWVRYWDGNTTITSGRKHAMGVLVEQRGLLWNFPSGNQDIMYFLFRFINITATDAARYAGLSEAGYSDLGHQRHRQHRHDFHNRSRRRTA